MSLTPGFRLGRYEVVAPMGVGGMGEVYRATDTRLARTVALKVLHARPDSAETGHQVLDREARAVASLNHPHICTLYDVGCEGAVEYLVMECLEGETLEDLLQAGLLPPDRVVTYARQLASALAAAHAKGVVHRDIKPANLFITTDGTLKVLDFGIAKTALLDPLNDQTRRRTTQPGTFVGTVRYAAPEQLRGEPIDPRTDIFAVGAVLSELLSGRAPFARATAVDTMSAILHDDPPVLPQSVPQTLASAIARCLAKNPARRYQSAIELLQALETPSPAPVAAMPSIAVLPFADLSPAHDQEYFCDGMADELIAALMSLDGVRVASRSSAFQFKGQPGDVGDIGRRLKVNNVLEGSVRRAGNRLRVTVQLTDVAEGFQIWSARYDRALDDVFAVQDEIARAIVARLKVTLRRGDAPLVTAATSNIEAYTLYLKGRYLLFKLTLDGLAQGMEHLKRAVALQHDYAEAYASMAYGYLLHALFSLAAPRTVMPLAKSAAEAALRLNPNLAEGHIALATVRHWYEWDWTPAESGYRRAIELSPADGNARFNYAEFLISRSRFDEAIDEAGRAIECDPVSPIVNRAMGDALYVSGRFDEAIAHAERAIAMEPTFFSTYWVLGLSLAGQGRYMDAVHAFERARPYAHGDAPLEGFLGWAAALAGDRTRAATIARELESRRAAGYLAASNIGIVHQGLGNLDEAMRWYEQAFADRSGECVSYLNNPHFAAAREHPRFQVLLAHIESGVGEPAR